jgi:hypothetical protein
MDVGLLSDIHIYIIIIIIYITHIDHQVACDSEGQGESYAEAAGLFSMIEA